MTASASSNLVATYFDLGLAVPGARRYVEDGFEGCVGPFCHPVCNFAVNLRLDPWSARRLCEVASEARVFNVYRLPGDEPAYVDELLTRNDFRLQYRLLQMEAEGRPGAGVEFHSCDVKDRLETALFMGGQFLNRQDLSVKAGVAESIAHATALELFSMRRSGRIVAAAMLGRRDGVCGLYNLCVGSPLRGQGIGGGFVRWALDQAYRRGERVVLQCESKLEGWYRRLGFATAGAVEVYALAKGLPNDIIEIV